MSDKVYTVAIAGCGKTGKVHGMYYEDGMSSWLNAYRVRQQGGRWRVVKDKLLVVS